jgi:DNA gyrase subunit A
VEKGDELVLTTERGQLVRIPTDEIRTIGRASKGVKIMNLRETDRITGAAKIVKVEGEESSIQVEAVPDAGVVPVPDDVPEIDEIDDIDDINDNDDVDDADIAESDDKESDDKETV